MPLTHGGGPDLAVLLPEVLPARDYSGGIEPVTRPLIQVLISEPHHLWVHFIEMHYAH